MAYLLALSNLTLRSSNCLPAMASLMTSSSLPAGAPACLPACPPAYLPARLLACPPARLPARPPSRPSVRPPARPPAGYRTQNSRLRPTSSSGSVSWRCRLLWLHRSAHARIPAASVRGAHSACTPSEPDTQSPVTSHNTHTVI